MRIESRAVPAQHIAVMKATLDREDLGSWIPAAFDRVVAYLRANGVAPRGSQVGTAPAHRQLQPGDRLPDATVICDGRTVRLHELTATPAIHLLLSRDAEQPEPLGPRVHVHRLTSRPGGDLVAVRPDGYVGLRTGPADPAVLRSWLDLVGASPPCGGRGRDASSY